MTQTLHGRTNKRWRISAARCGPHRPPGAGGGRPADRRPAPDRPRRLRARSGPHVSRRQADRPARPGPAARRAGRGRPRSMRPFASRRKIVVYGDYDADGMTGTAILLSCLKLLGADASYYVPNRLEEGYGLNVRGAAVAGRARGVAGRHRRLRHRQPGRSGAGPRAGPGADRHRPSRVRRRAARRGGDRSSAAAGHELSVRRPVRGGRGAQAGLGHLPAGQPGQARQRAAAELPAVGRRPGGDRHGGRRRAAGRRKPHPRAARPEQPEGTCRRSAWRR